MLLKKAAIKVAATALCSTLIIPSVAGHSFVGASAADSSQPYNITVGIGSSESEARINWMSTESAAGVLEIAKASDVKNGQFPANSSKNASVSEATATEGVADAPTNTNHPVSALKDANGASLANEYANRVTVDGLAADTSYTYRVGDGTTWSKTYTFKTENTKNGFTFAAFGDPQIGASGNITNDQNGWAKTLQKVTSKYPNLNFLFSLGDEVNDYDHLYTQQQQYKSFFNPSSSADYLQTHLLAALSGNHDFQMGRYYSFHYNLPNLSTLGQTVTNGVDDNNGDYWFRYGDALFMVLEGNNFYDVAAHDQFMQSAVAANPDARWKIAAFHQAPYSEADHDGSTSAGDDIMFMRGNWPKLMDKYGVDVVLNGHDHYYTRTYQMYGGSPVNTVKTNSVTNPKGTVYFTLDSGSGSKYYKYNESADHSFSSFGWQNNQPTYSYINVTDNALTVTTYTADTDNEVDTYTINKTPAAPKTVKTAAPTAASGTVKSAGTSSKTANPDTGESDASGYLIALGLILLVAAAGGAVLLRKKRA